MNMAQLEIYKAVRKVQSGPTILRQVCTICKHYLNTWDLKSKKAVCWYCRKKYFPTPQPVEQQPEPKQFRLVQQKDGLYAITAEELPNEPKRWGEPRTKYPQKGRIAEYFYRTKKRKIYGPNN